MRKTDGAEFDLDASAFVLDTGGKVLSDQHFVFYNNAKDPSGAVSHKGDNRTGAGEGDDEMIEIDLGLMTPNAAKVAFVVTIHDAEARKQNFAGQQRLYPGTEHRWRRGNRPLRPVRGRFDRDGDDFRRTVSP